MPNVLRLLLHCALQLGHKEEHVRIAESVLHVLQISVDELALAPIPAADSHALLAAQGVAHFFKPEPIAKLSTLGPEAGAGTKWRSAMGGSQRNVLGLTVQVPGGEGVGAGKGEGDEPEVPVSPRDIAGAEPGHFGPMLLERTLTAVSTAGSFRIPLSPASDDDSDSDGAPPPAQFGGSGSGAGGSSLRKPVVRRVGAAAVASSQAQAVAGDTELEPDLKYIITKVIMMVLPPSCLVLLSLPLSHMPPPPYVCVCVQYFTMPRAVVCVFGGASGLHSLLVPNLKRLIAHGVVPAATALGGMILDGGTNAGVMQMVGDTLKRTRQNCLRCLGVVPHGTVVVAVAVM